MKEQLAKNGSTLRSIFIPQTILIIIFSLLLSSAGIALNIRTESDRRDINLINIAEAVAKSGVIRNIDDPQYLCDYVDDLQGTLGSIDVLSIIGADNRRVYHTNHSLIGTLYDGTIPDLSSGTAYTTSDAGPSGSQRRAYAPIYDENAQQAGFVLAVMLNTSIRAETEKILFTYSLITLIVIAAELLLAYRISMGIRQRLNGYEPDAFSAMFGIRENILESLSEGIIAVDSSGSPQYINAAALAMTGPEKAGQLLKTTVLTGEKQNGSFENGLDGAVILVDRMPIIKNGRISGAVGILHDRTEYTRIAEELAGTRFLVDSMRANNHDFINKLQVILGLLEMEMYDEAVKYISNIAFVQRELISSVMHAIDEPSLAALIIGKIARAAELNIRFTLQEGCCLHRSDIRVPSDTLITVAGNLIQNAFEAITSEPVSKSAEVSFGVWTKPGMLLMNVTDTGCGIQSEIASRIFDNGFTTKGEGHGTGLYQLKTMLEAAGGSISFKSIPGGGTSFTVRVADSEGEKQ